MTCIPCGHSYCSDCKDGFEGDKCHKCGPKFEVEAVYRNELLDELLLLF